MDRQPNTTPVADRDVDPTPNRTCECDCKRWIHLVAAICLVDPPSEELAQMWFEDDRNTDGIFPRRCCRPCADHIRVARARNGERMISPALMSVDVSER
jgi:hypothetical protein